MDNIEILICSNKQDELTKYITQHEINIDGIRDIAKNLIRERFNMKEDVFDAVDFVFWFSYLVERDAEDLIIESEVSAGGRRAALETIVRGLSFGNKITIIKNLYSSSKDKDSFIKIMKEIKNLRNNIAHGKVKNLEYKGHSLSCTVGKLQLIDDLRIALNKE